MTTTNKPEQAKRRASEKAKKAQRPPAGGELWPRSAVERICLLRLRIAANDATKDKRQRGNLCQALLKLEADYERLERLLGGTKQAPLASTDDDILFVMPRTTGTESDELVEREVLPFVPTPPIVIDAMLRLADVGEDDVVYELGCGDGRMAIVAARDYGAKALGIDIDPDRIAEAQDAAKQAGVTKRVQFKRGDLFDADLRDASVVMMYLLPSYNAELRPKLLRELRPGARVVSHAFDMPGWDPDRAEVVEGHYLFLWRVRRGIGPPYRS